MKPDQNQTNRPGQTQQKGQPTGKSGTQGGQRTPGSNQEGVWEKNRKDEDNTGR